MWIGMNTKQTETSTETCDAQMRDEMAAIPGAGWNQPLPWITCGKVLVHGRCPQHAPVGRPSDEF